MKEEMKKIEQLDTRTKLTAVREWYYSQSDAPLFRGEDNEITLETIYHRINWLGQIGSKSPAEQAKFLPRLNRMYYYNVIKWPEERRQARYEKLFQKEVAA